MKKSGITSTVVLGIFLVICVFFIIRLVPVNLAEQLKTYSEQSAESGPDTEEMGEMIIVYSLVLGIGALSIIIGAHFIAAVPLVISAICLPFALNNRRSDSKAIKVINIGYAVVFSAVVVTSVVKIILFWI